MSLLSKELNMVKYNRQNNNSMMSGSGTGSGAN
jgi:hypothetical protein